MATCTNCGVSFAPTKEHQKFCNRACRQAGYRARKKGGAVSKPKVTRNESAPASPPAPATFDEATARVVELAEQIESGAVFNYEALTKKQQAIIGRFKRDHGDFHEAVQMAFSISSRQWAKEALADEQEHISRRYDDLHEKEAELKTMKETLQGLKYADAVAGADLKDWKRIRSFVAPDKHAGCPSEDKAHDVAIALRPIIEKAEDTLKARAKHTKEKEARKAAADKVVNDRRESNNELARQGSVQYNTVAAMFKDVVKYADPVEFVTYGELMFRLEVKPDRFRKGSGMNVEVRESDAGAWQRTPQKNADAMLAAHAAASNA